jgi:hypothetical protein
MLAGEMSVDLTIVGIVLVFVGLVALTTWWSAFCQRKFRQP